jgi:uncharacterized membrane protein YkoI
MSRSFRNRKTALVAAGALAVAAIGGGAAIAAGRDDGSGSPITGDALAKAKAAALAETSGGKVTGTEVGDEESYYEVEVTKADGSQVDVQLNKSFAVVGSKDDGHDNENEQGDS